MVEELLLQAKSDYKELEVNWISGFLACHHTLKSKYSQYLGQKHFLAQNQDIIQEWFNLYQSIKAKYGILDKNMYNIDDNSYIARSSKVVFSK